MSQPGVSMWDAARRYQRRGAQLPSTSSPSCHSSATLILSSEFGSLNSFATSRRKSPMQSILDMMEECLVSSVRIKPTQSIFLFRDDDEAYAFSVQT